MSVLYFNGLDERGIENMLTLPEVGRHVENAMRTHQKGIHLIFSIPAQNAFSLLQATFPKHRISHVGKEEQASFQLQYHPHMRACPDSSVLMQAETFFSFL